MTTRKAAVDRREEPPRLADPVVEAVPHSSFKRLVRTAICAALFGIPLCVAIPNSPLLKLSLTQENAAKTVVPRMMSDFFYVNALASGVAYAGLIEPSIQNPKACGGFLPYLGPLTAHVPGFACLFASHLFYPGMWAIFNETTWRSRRREFVRLNTKCFLAFAPQHLPAIVALSTTIGVLLYPFKFFKNRAWKRVSHHDDAGGAHAATSARSQPHTTP